MDYNTRVTGEIRIEPPLTYAEFKNSPFIAGDSLIEGSIDVRLRVEEETVDTDEGQLVRKTASALIPKWEEPYRAYHLIEHVQRAIDVFTTTGIHMFSGRLECEGEEQGDMWRVVIRDGRAVRVEPRIVWPDDEPEAAR